MKTFHHSDLYQVTVIDNLDLPENAAIELPDISILEKICDLIISGIQNANSNNEYTDNEIRHLIKNKTPITLQRRLAHGYLVYITNREGTIIACGMIIKNNKHYEAKTLHVHAGYRNRGLAKLVCDIREERVRQTGTGEMYIESLRFENTVKFHTKRGFKQVPPAKPLRYSIFMKKNL